MHARLPGDIRFCQEVDPRGGHGQLHACPSSQARGQKMISYMAVYIQWNPLNTKLKGLMKVFMLSEFHVIRTIRNTKCIAGVIFYFHVNQNSV